MTSKIKESNLHYTRRITPKRVTSGEAHLRGLAPGQHSSKETSQRWRAVYDTVSNLISLATEPRISRTDSFVFNTATHLTITSWLIFQANSVDCSCFDFAKYWPRDVDRGSHFSQFKMPQCRDQCPSDHNRHVFAAFSRNRGPRNITDVRFKW